MLSVWVGDVNSKKGFQDAKGDFSDSRGFLRLKSYKIRRNIVNSTTKGDRDPPTPLLETTQACHGFFYLNCNFCDVVE